LVKLEKEMNSIYNSSEVIQNVLKEKQEDDGYICYYFDLKYTLSKMK